MSLQHLDEVISFSFPIFIFEAVDPAESFELANRWVFFKCFFFQEPSTGCWMHLDLVIDSSRVLNSNFLELQRSSNLPGRMWITFYGCITIVVSKMNQPYSINNRTPKIIYSISIHPVGAWRKFEFMFKFQTFHEHLKSPVW